MGGRAITKESDRHAAISLQRLRVGRTADQADATADDAIGAQDPPAQICNVHGATHPLAHTRYLGMDLGHHGPHVTAFGQKVTMPTVVAGDPVGVAQVLAYTHAYGFLSAVKVHASNQLTCLEVCA